MAYSISAVVAALGENKLMPLPDCACKVINGKSGYVRENSSWVIGRLMRDFDMWANDETRRHLERMIGNSWKFQQANAERRQPGSGSLVAKPAQTSLCVSVYEALPARPGRPDKDMVYWSGFAVAVVQLGIAAIPCGLFGDWGILLLTGVGILLAFASGSLPQFTKAKWPCRRDSNKTVILTKGNGCQHAIIILSSAGKGLDLEDLAASPTNLDTVDHLQTRSATIVLAVLWILLLITAAGIKANTWFLLAVGGIGMLHAMFVAGYMRYPAAFGIPLEFQEVIGEPKVMETLLAVESKYPQVGKSMIDMFFPGGGLRDDEKAAWVKLEAEQKKKTEETSDNIEA